MKNKIIVGNFKMNLDKKEIFSYLEKAKTIKYENVVFCPTNLYLPYFLKENLCVGIQNISSYEKGAYTGEVAAFQAKSLGVTFCLIGHSERRMYFKEDKNELTKKLELAFKNGLKVIYCIGEKKSENEMQKTNQVLKEELEILKPFSNQIHDNLFIAYEPIWAIGTGEVPDNKTIQKVATFIKEVMQKDLNIPTIPVLYGGSINEENIALLNEIDELSGFLVGGASTKIDTFLKLIEVVVTQ